MARGPEDCSIARTLDVVGERWTLLVVREALRGRTRFAEFRDALGIATDILTARLKLLVDAGVLERRPYREPGARERSSYHLTQAGHDLRLVLFSLQQWGDEHRAAEPTPPMRLVKVPEGTPARVGLQTPDGVPLADDEVRAVPVSRDDADRSVLLPY